MVILSKLCTILRPAFSVNLNFLLLSDASSTDNQNVKQDKQIIFFLLVGLLFAVVNVYNLDQSDISESSSSYSSAQLESAPFAIVKDAADTLLGGDVPSTDAQAPLQTSNSRSPASALPAVSQSPVLSVSVNSFTFECMNESCKKNNEYCSHNSQCYSENCLNNRCQVSLNKN